MTSLQSTTSRNLCWNALPPLSVVSILALLLSSACSSVLPVRVDSAPIQVPRPTVQVLPDPEVLHQLPLKFQTVGRDKSLPADEPFVCLTPEAYEILSRNTAETARWITEARWRLDYYRAQLGVK